MKKTLSMLVVVLLLGMLPVCSFAKNIEPWLLEFGDAKWGPVPANRLQTDIFVTNGNIVSKYHENTGVLYHSYHGNPNDHYITREARTDVIITPPDGAMYWQPFYCEGISLTEYQNSIRSLDRRDESNKDPFVSIDRIGDFNLARFDTMPATPQDGPPYYQMMLYLFDRNDTGSLCTPKQLASENRGNLYLVAWYNKNKQLIRVDWLVETSDDFSVRYQDISEVLFPSYDEKNLPSVIDRPTLINPIPGMNIQLIMYHYSDYRGNTDFAELVLLDPDQNVITDFHLPVVIYWPYPEGYDMSSPVHYQLKHYMDNTRTKFKFVDVTPTEKGLRFETDSFSPFELTWSEVGELPETGDESFVLLWSILAFLSVMGIMLRLRHKKEA